MECLQETARRLTNNSSRISGLKCCVIKTETSGMPIKVYSKANVLFSKHLSCTETVLVLNAMVDECQRH